MFFIVAHAFSNTVCNCMNSIQCDGKANSVIDCIIFQLWYSRVATNSFRLLIAHKYN